MSNHYYNYGKDLYLEKSIFKKIDFLINSGVCFIKEENHTPFIDELSFLDDNYSHNELREKIASLNYLEFNQLVISEVSKTVSNLIHENTNEQSFYGVLLREKFKAKLLLPHDLKSKKKIIKKHLKKALKTIKNTFDFDLHSLGTVNEDLSVNHLPIIANSFYDSYFLCPDDTYYNENINLKVKKDALTHIFPPGNPQLNMYEIGEKFLLIMDMLNFIKELKQELKKIDHNIIARKEANGSNYNLQNVNNDINRFPLVFKDAYSCELFLYIFSHLYTNKPILFSYFYEIFKYKHFKKKGFRIKYYFEFLNSVYGSNEKRVRPILSNDKYDFYINRFKELKIDFDKEKASKINL